MLQTVVLTGLTALALCYFIWQWRSGALAEPSEPSETSSQAVATHAPSFLPRRMPSRIHAPQWATVVSSRRGVHRFRAAA